MGGFSVAHWLILAVVVLLLFGRGRISEMMGDIGKGVTSFKKGLSDSDDAKRDEPRRDALIAPPRAEEARRVEAAPVTVTPVDVTPVDVTPQDAQRTGHDADR